LARLLVLTVPLLERKRLVERIVAASSGSLRAVPHVVGDGRDIAAFVAEHELEGFVAKRVSSPYCPGPSPSWVKVKRRAEEDFVVTRVRRDKEGRVDALAVAVVDGGRLRAQGVVELGAWRVSKALPRPASSQRPGWTESPRDLLVTVTFTGRTGAGRLREAVVKGVRSVT
jgi:bifunctional non-homologous end joining protein LigD